MADKWSKNGMNESSFFVSLSSLLFSIFSTDFPPFLHWFSTFLHSSNILGNAFVVCRGAEKIPFVGGLGVGTGACVKLYIIHIFTFRL